MFVSVFYAFVPTFLLHHLFRRVLEHAIVCVCVCVFGMIFKSSPHFIQTITNPCSTHFIFVCMTRICTAPCFVCTLFAINIFAYILLFVINSTPLRISIYLAIYLSSFLKHIYSSFRSASI